MKRDNLRGMALITILMMLIILVILTTTMIAINANKLFYSAHYFKKTSALITAESGVAFAMYALQEDFTWNPDNYEHKTQSGTFNIKFCHSGYNPPFFSYNNLGLSSVYQAGAAFDGTDVRENSVDLVVTGRSGELTQRLRLILTRSLTNDAGRCTGLVDVEAQEFRISKAITPQDPSGKGSFHTNSSGNPPDHPVAIDIDSSCLVITGDGVISAVGDIAPLNTTDTTAKPNSLAKNIPDLDIPEIIDGKISSLSPGDLHPGGTYEILHTESGDYKLRYGGGDITLSGTRVEDGTIIISDDLCFTGDVEFKFVNFPDDNLSKAGIFFEKSENFYPSLYIQGDGLMDYSFQVSGKMSGNGSVYTSGTSSFIMETNIVASDDPGVALLSEGDVEINLPATHVKPVELNMTGLVYTHGNINSCILSDSSTNNPQNDPTSPWVGDWEDIVMGIENEVYALPVGNFNLDTNHSPAVTYEFWWNFTGGDHYDPDNPINGLLINNGDGTFTFQGGTDNGNADAVRAFWRYSEGTDCSGAVAFTVGDETEVTFNSTGSDPSLGWHDEGALSSLFGSYEDAYASFYNTMLEYDFASDPSVKVIKKSLEGELYAPDIYITGALIVADPDNLSGGGSYNPLRGNVDIDLDESWLENKGNFNLKYSSNYEKLLGNPMISNNLRVTSWEEVR